MRWLELRRAAVADKAATKLLALSGRDRSGGGVRLLPDSLGETVEFLVQSALFFAAQTAAMLRSHIVFFLLDGAEPLMQAVTAGRRIVALGDVCIDAVRFVVDTLFDLLGAMQGGDMRIGCRGLRRRDNAGGQ